MLAAARYEDDLACKLDKLFAPQSIALVGISADPHKLNGIPLRTLRRHGFPGSIYLVNPKHEEIDGLTCYPSVDDLPGPVDVALVMVPAKFVPEVIRACGRRGIGNAVVLSSGFEETGNDSQLVDELRDAAVSSGVAVVGPNCEGIWSVKARTILTFGSAANRDELSYGPIAVISQSGSVGGAVVRHLQDAGQGCAYFVSVGNETLIDSIDYLEWIVKREDVRVVLLFLEGLTKAERLREVAALAHANGVRLVALKSGASAIGLEATASHTGKVATPHRVYDSVLRQCGIQQVLSISDLIDAADVLANLPVPLQVTGPTPGVGVFSIPGGTRALTADACERLTVPLASFEGTTVQKLEERLPSFGYAGNPTDITGQVLSDQDLFTSCLNLVIDDPNVEALIVQFANRGPSDARNWRQLLKDAACRSGMPIIISFLGDVLPAKERAGFTADGLFCARDPADAVKYLSWLYGVRNAELAAQRPRSRSTAACRATCPPQDDLESWARCLARAGIGVPRWHIVDATSDPTACAQELHYPLVVKALPSAADHKTEAGLLRLGIENEELLHEAVVDLRCRLPQGASLLVQEMVTDGVEAVLSVTRDRDFGPMLAVGAGGVLVELFNDVTFLIPPFDLDDVAEALGRLRISRQLAGFRGSQAADVGAFHRAAVGLMDLFLSFKPDIQELELNPVFVRPGGGGVMAADLLVRY